jgi:isopenicillin N synthase-like dioxygenase
MASTNGHTGQIPVIDLSGSLPESQIARDLVVAAATYGFVYVKNQGKDIPAEVIDGIFDLVSLNLPHM